MSETSFEQGETGHLRLQKRDPGHTDHINMARHNCVYPELEEKLDRRKADVEQHERDRKEGEKDAYLDRSKFRTLSWAQLN